MVDEGGPRDPLDRLTDRLLNELDRRGDAPAAGCLGRVLVGQRLAGRLDGPTQARVDAHLETCLACLDTFVEIRDHLQGLADPQPVSPTLRRVLDELVADAPRPRRQSESRERFRRLVTVRFPAWAVAGVAAAVILTWGIAHYVERAPERLTPAHTQTTRTVSGVVSSVRDATSNGVDAHVVSLTDRSGATYVLFAWGRPTVHAGEAVEIEGIFASAKDTGGQPVYQGVATAMRRAR
jgi:predicted anti-sigma-YlaC factor YlaD